MIKYFVASALVILTFSPVKADDAIKTKLALGCVEKEVAKTVASEMVKYAGMINNQERAQFTEDCEVFVEGDAVVVIERPAGDEFIKAQRPQQIKMFWLPASSIVGEEQPK